MEHLSTIKQNFIHYIDKIITNHRISHAYLIEVDDYDQDFSYILSFVKMIFTNLNYEELSKQDLPLFHQIDTQNYPDLKVIDPDGSTIKKSQLLDLQKDYNNKSLLDGKRIYIIREAEKLNPASANTILKFLEEPEEDIIALLITDNRYHVLETILSRCQILSLKENSLVFPEEDSLVELLRTMIYPKEFFLNNKNILDTILIDKEEAKEKFFQIEKILISYLNSKYLDSSLNSQFMDLLKDSSQSKLLNILNVLEKEIPKLDFNVNFKLWLDNLFSKLIIGG